MQPPVHLLASAFPSSHARSYIALRGCSSSSLPLLAPRTTVSPFAQLTCFRLSQLPPAPPGSFPCICTCPAQLSGPSTCLPCESFHGHAASMVLGLSSARPAPLRPAPLTSNLGPGPPNPGLPSPRLPLYSPRFLATRPNFAPCFLYTPSDLHMPRIFLTL